MPRPRRSRNATLPGNGGREVIREEAVNTFLAQLLRDQGIPARAERRNRNTTPDVRITLKTGDAVLLECKWEDSASQLESQLDTRLQQFPDALGVIGVLYPHGLKYLEDTREGLEHAGDLEWWLHGSRGEPAGALRSRFGSPADIADHLRVLPLELEGTDRVVAAAAVIEHAVEQSAAKLATHARLSYLVKEAIAQTDRETDRAKALRIGCLVIFNALAFHLRLASTNDAVPTVAETWRDGGVPGLLKVWDHICETIDYVPVFDLAKRMLTILDYADVPHLWHGPIMEPILKAVEDTSHLAGHDLSGRLFHTLLSDAKFTGAYYTSVPAATLLTRLVFHDWPPGVDWSDHEFPASLNVADIACGTGTLLMAVAAEAERRHTEAGGQNAPALHKAMVEQALHGYDVQLSAVHFAATSLAMLNPDIQFDRINLYVMPLGADGDDVSLGSLDFLGESQAAVQFALSPAGMGASGRTIRDAGRVYGGGSRGAEQEELATLPDLDLAIMNPPFTRSVGGNLLFGSLPPADRRKLQDELSRRLKSRQATATAGLGAAFVAAASPKLRPGEGRLALVLPATVCTGPSWQQTRSLIERDFTLDTVIVSHDPQRWNFSDSTDLSEALLIATRRSANGDSNDARATFVSLWQNPDGVLDAHRTAQAIAETTPANLEDTGAALVTVDGRHVGELVSIPESMLMGRKWAGVQFARADLTRSALRLLDDGEVWVPGESATGQVPLCPMAELGEIGPDRRRLVDGFERTTVQTAYPMMEGHDTEQRKSMLCVPDAYLSPLVTPRGGQRPGYGDHLWLQAGRLLIAERLWLETNRVIAMRTDTKVLSNVWWPVKMDEVAHEKALAVWLNSSLGLLTLLAQRTSTRGGWVGMKKADLEQLPMLNVRAVPPHQLQALSHLFDATSADEFQRLPAMAHCPARRRLDNGLSKTLNLPDLAGLRRLLSSEPVVTNRRL